jgi:serine/threonine protein phosphatase PrpC
MSTARLHGADHAELGEVATISEGDAAIVISRGGAQKRYAHREPNEDSVGFAGSEWGAVAAIADGHAGSQAARISVDRVLDTHAKRWLAASPIALDARFASEAAEVAFDINTAILKAAAGNRVDESRTTLAAVLVRPREGWMAAFSIGDSHVFRVEASETREIAALEEENATYLGEPVYTLELLHENVRTEVTPLEGVRAVVLATDGLSEKGIGVADPEAAVAQALQEAGSTEPDLQALHAARGVARRAMEAQRKQRAGDNIAVAVLWLD